MNHMYTKDEYISIHSELYDVQMKILEDRIIPNLELVFEERDLFFSPPVEFKERKYTVNVYNWLNELNELRNHIFYELILCRSYNDIADNYDAPIRGSLIYIDRERYLRILLYDLFSYREKLSFLIYELFNRDIGINNSKKVSFHNVYKGVCSIEDNSISWLTKNQIAMIRKILEEIKNHNGNELFNNLRHAYTHRSNPGVDCMSMRIHNYPIVPELEIYKTMVKDNGEDLNLHVVSDKPSEAEVKFEDVFPELMDYWRTLISSLYRLISEVDVVSYQVEEVIFEEGRIIVGSTVI